MERRSQPARARSLDATPSGVIRTDRCKCDARRCHRGVAPNSGRTDLVDPLVSLAGAAGIALLVPFAILVIGIPVALTVRGLLEGIGWLFGIVPAKPGQFAAGFKNRP